MSRAPIAVALDAPDLETAARWAQAVTPHVAVVKVGLELFCRTGPSVVDTVRGASGVDLFLDLKLHDIPNTVEGAVQAIAHLDPAVLTVHAAGGKAMMRAAKAAAPPRTKVVAVTVLTSLDQDDLASIGVDGEPASQVERLAALAREAGLDGIVCSGAEVARARAGWPDGFLVVPGVRPAGFQVGDQKRIVTPQQAVADGASALVIGRPITEAMNPRRALMDIVASLEQTPAAEDMQ